MSAHISITNQELDKGAQLLKSAAHPTRLKILCFLARNKRLSVSQLMDAVECEQSLLSHHLNLMRTNGLLAVEREGKNVFYSLADKKFKDLIKCIEE